MYLEKLCGNVLSLIIKLVESLKKIEKYILCMCLHLCSNLISIVEGLQRTSLVFPWSAASLHTEFYSYTGRLKSMLFVIGCEANEDHSTEEVCVTFINSYSSSFLTFTQNLCNKNITINLVWVVCNRSKEQKFSKSDLLTFSLLI